MIVSWMNILSLRSSQLYSRAWRYLRHAAQNWSSLTVWEEERGIDRYFILSPKRIHNPVCVGPLDLRLQVLIVWISSAYKLCSCILCDGVMGLNKGGEWERSHSLQAVCISLLRCCVHLMQRRSSGIWQHNHLNGKRFWLVFPTTHILLSYYTALPGDDWGLWCYHWNPCRSVNTEWTQQIWSFADKRASGSGLRNNSNLFAASYTGLKQDGFGFFLWAVFLRSSLFHKKLMPSGGVHWNFLTAV